MYFYSTTVVYWIVHFIFYIIQIFIISLQVFKKLLSLKYLKILFDSLVSFVI